jgi:hypothetical protein
MAENVLSLADLFPVSTEQAQVKAAIDRSKEICEEAVQAKYKVLQAGLRHVSLTVVFTKDAQDEILQFHHYEEPCDLFIESEKIIQNIDSFLANSTHRILSLAEAAKADEKWADIKNKYETHLKTLSLQPTEIHLRQLRAIGVDDQIAKINNLPLEKLRSFLLSWREGSLYEIHAQVRPILDVPAKQAVNEKTFQKPSKMDQEQGIIIPSLQYG